MTADYITANRRRFLRIVTGIELALSRQKINVGRPYYWSLEG